MLFVVLVYSLRNLCAKLIPTSIKLHKFRETVENMHRTLDQFDLTLLRALEKDGAMTNAKLAEIVGLSTSQCSRRRSQLEVDGAITGYHARLDPTTMGRSLQAIVRVSLTSHSEENSKNFSKLIERSDQVKEAFAVSGDSDYVLLVSCMDLAALSDFIHKKILSFPNVGQVKSEIALYALK